MTQDSGHQSQPEQEPLGCADSALQDDANQCSSDPDASQSDDSAGGTQDERSDLGSDDQGSSDSAQDPRVALDP